MVIACTASEFLTLAPIIKRFLERVVKPQGIKLAHVESMIAVLEVLELLQACKVEGLVSKADLRRAIENHLVKFKAAYGGDAMKPKHHYSLHLPDMHRPLQAVFTHERKHRAVKRYSRGRTTLKSFDCCVLEDVTCHNIWELKDKL